MLSLRYGTQQYLTVASRKEQKSFCWFSKSEFHINRHSRTTRAGNSTVGNVYMLEPRDTCEICMHHTCARSDPGIDFTQ